MGHQVISLDDSTWRIEEHVEGGSTYMYLLAGEREAVLIDTGFGTLALREIVSSLTALPVHVINTHGHFDHTGGNPLFDIACIHEADVPVYRAFRDAQKRYPQYTIPAPVDNFKMIRDGDTFDLGARTLEVIVTPGHTLGSLCILDKERRWLFTGDTCCKADVLLNLDFCTTVETYCESMRGLLARRAEFDVTWPAHHETPVSPEVLDQFLEAGKLLCEGKAEGEPMDTIFGACLRFPFKEIAIVYLPERIKNP